MELKCDLCKREIDYDELYEFTELYEWYGDLSICNQCGPKVEELVRQMKALNINPEIHPLRQNKVNDVEDRKYKEWQKEKGVKVEFTPYDSNYTGFTVSEAGAKMRKSAIDEMLKIKDEKKRYIVEKIIEEIDGAVAEGLMGGVLSPCTVAIEAMYETAMIIAMCIEKW